MNRSDDAQEQLSTDACQPAKPLAPGLCRRILIVEDNLVTMEYLIKVIAKAGYKPVPALHAEEALKVVWQEPIDLILTDIMMPDMDGITMVKQIRQMPHLAHLPILMVTADNDRQSVMASAQYHIQGYLVKPVDRQLLLERIAQALKNSSPSSTDSE
jgi:CheY-like chemotaxis protein